MTKIHNMSITFAAVGGLRLTCGAILYDFDQNGPSQFQLEFSLVDLLSMSSRTKSRQRRVGCVIDRGKSNIFLLNANLRSSKTLKGRGVCLFCLNASDIGFSNKVYKITFQLNQIRLRKQTFTCKGVLDKDCPVYVIVRFVN